VVLGDVASRSGRGADRGRHQAEDLQGFLDDGHGQRVGERFFLGARAVGADGALGLSGGDDPQDAAGRGGAHGGVQRSHRERVQLAQLLRGEGLEHRQREHVPRQGEVVDQGGEAMADRRGLRLARRRRQRPPGHGLAVLLHVSVEVRQPQTQVQKEVARAEALETSDVAGHKYSLRKTRIEGKQSSTQGLKV